jgi:glycosyltransferase involved in cell wall biosynthesis
MKIVVNDIAASTGGAMTILKDFYKYLIDSNDSNEWVFLLGDYYLEETQSIKVLIFPEIKRSWINKLIFDFITGRKVIKKLHPDIVLSLQNIMTFGLKIPQVVYIHQAIPFQSVKRFSFLNKDEAVLALYQYVIGSIIILSAKRADKVIVQTKSMQKEVCKVARIPFDKTTYIYPSIANLVGYRNENDFDRKRFFYPTNDSLYKNNETIVKACDILQTKNVTNFKVVLTIDSDIKNPLIDCIGRIDRNAVLSEYSKSTLISPTYIESYPLPLSEARQIGTIIIASDCDFSKEILEGYENAYFFDPFSPKELSDLMYRVIHEDITKNDNQCSFGENTEDESWGKLVKQLDYVIQSKLNIGV